MKRFLVAMTILFGFVPVAALAHNGEVGESIQSFEVRARLESNRQLTVTEIIAYDFEETPRHGIYRDIPVRYERNGGTYLLRLSVDSVTMDGASAPYDLSRQGDDLRIKIGDPDKTITGEHTYIITYHTDRAINFFDGEAELYWNVTGDKWQVPIRFASFVVTGPEGFDGEAANTVCYTGVVGSKEEACNVSGTGTQVTVGGRRSLGPGEGLTIAIRFPEGLITPPSTLDLVLQFIADNWALGIPVLTLIAMLWLWDKKGRDPKGRGTVVPHYEAPRGLTPAEMISLKEQQTPTRAITATILDLARRGFLKIDFGEEQGLLKKKSVYTFIKTPHHADPSSDLEKEVYEGLFADGDRTELSDLKGKFYKHVEPFKRGIFASLKQKELFERNPAAVRATYVGIAVTLVVIGIWFIGPFTTAVTVVSLIVSGLIVAIVGWFMPRVTQEGAVALEEVEGFKWFLSVTEKDRLKFHNAPAIKPAMFHQFLPAAVAFGVEEEWAKQFEGLDIPPPSYATGNVIYHWAALSFVHDLSDLNRAAVASAYVAPSSAGAGRSGFGGGGVGGGFGGGGGGSW